MNFKQFLKERDSKTSVGMVIFSDDKVLIVKRGPSAPWMPNKWSLTGGMVDEGETLEEAIIREVYEETKIKPNNMNYLGDFDDWHVYTGDTDFKQVDLEMENNQHDWIRLENLDDYDFVPHAKEAIEQAFTLRN
jgi:8-oxo-dGTP pyrophosphatase MutT (NUDIX family)